MLLFDVGNSRCKWALVRDGRWTHTGVDKNSEFQALQRAISELPAPSRILISNVAGAQMAEHLRTFCAQWDCPLEFVSAQKEQCGVRNSYRPPQRLGSDRWAALVASWHRVHGACLVVNCGTATTVDALSPEGEFIGGLILPGLDLMHQSMLGNTAQLSAEDGVLCEYPLNTSDAIHSGVLRATLDPIEHQFTILAQKYTNVRCVLGGGAADRVQPHLALPLDYVDNLVLCGLQIIGEEKV